MVVLPLLHQVRRLHFLWHCMQLKHIMTLTSNYQTCNKNAFWSHIFWIFPWHEWQTLNKAFSLQTELFDKLKIKTVNNNDSVHSIPAGIFPLISLSLDCKTGSECKLATHTKLTGATRSLSGAYQGCTYMEGACFVSCFSKGFHHNFHKLWI